MNKKCHNCNVFVASDLVNCPLCGKYVEGNDGNEIATTYADSIKLTAPERMSGIDIVSKVLILLMMFCVLINVFLNVYFKYYFNPKHLWSLYVVACSLVVLFGVFNPIKKKRYKWGEIFWQLFALFVFFITIDALTDQSVDWSIAYVLPFFMTALCLSVGFITTFIKKIDPANCLLTILITLVLGIALVVLDSLLWGFKIIDINLIVPYIAFFINLAVFFALLIFKYKTFTKNLIKKFHA